MDNIIAFVDSVGRVVVGQKVNETKTELHVKSPAVVNVQVNQQNGQMSVQLLPYVFREFLDQQGRDNGVTWRFQLSSITLSDDISLDDAIKTQYENIHNAPIGNPEKTTKDNSPEVVKLFDDKD